MLRSVKDLKGHDIKANDGDIGRVHDFYLDDEAWAIRYLIVDTGRWLPGRSATSSWTPATGGEDTRCFWLADAWSRP